MPLSIAFILPSSKLKIYRFYRSHGNLHTHHKYFFLLLIISVEDIANTFTTVRTYMGNKSEFTK